MIDTATAATREAALVAQVGYTAVIDRMTPSLDLEVVAANVARSVGSAGGAPAGQHVFADAWAPLWCRGAVSVFERHRARGEFGTEGTFAFGISVEADGVLGSLVATAVLSEPSARLRGDAVAVSSAIRAVISGIRPGVALAELATILAQETTDVSAPVELSLLAIDGTMAMRLGPGDVVAEGEVIAVGALARTVEGPIAFQTTVHVGADGAERLEAFPLRLIELR